MTRCLTQHLFGLLLQVHAIVFSPDSRFIAVTHGSHVQIWRAPPLITQYRPFQLHRYALCKMLHSRIHKYLSRDLNHCSTLTGHHDDVLSIQWSSDSKFIVTGSADNTARVFSVDPVPGFVPLLLAGHKGAVVGCFFGDAAGADALTEPALPDTRVCVCICGFICNSGACSSSSGSPF